MIIIIIIVKKKKSLEIDSLRKRVRLISLPRFYCIVLFNNDYYIWLNISMEVYSSICQYVLDKVILRRFIFNFILKQTSLYLSFSFLFYWIKKRKIYLHFFIFLRKNNTKYFNKKECYYNINKYFLKIIHNK